jgi:hypothetical protein
MSTAYLVISAVVGWCGTLWPQWWRSPRPPKPEPQPWLKLSTIAAVGGVIGGFAITKVVAGSLIFIVIGAFAGGLAALAIADRIDQRK